jgi:hypothetical protein
MFTKCFASIGIIIYFNVTDDNKNMYGPIPSQFGQMANLRGLYLNNVGLVGTLPLEIGNLSSLYLLALADNALVGTIPETLENASNLRYLFLNGNYFTGPVPDFFAENNSNLYEVRIQDNLLMGNIVCYPEIGVTISITADCFGMNPKVKCECCICYGSNQPSYIPSHGPTESPTIISSKEPSSKPSSAPSNLPTLKPIITFSAKPSFQPTSQPSILPSLKPTASSSTKPSSEPSLLPSNRPSFKPSTVSSNLPSFEPSLSPSNLSLTNPTAEPTIGIDFMCANINKKQKCQRTKDCGFNMFEGKCKSAMSKEDCSKYDGKKRKCKRMGCKWTQSTQKCTGRWD